MAGTKQSFASMDVDNFNAAYKAFRGKIHTFARNAVHRVPGYEVEDIEQELCYILMRCVRDYDPNKGASFNTLTQASFQRRILDLIRLVNTKSRKATIVYLEQDEVRAAIEHAYGVPSAEDEAMGMEAVRACDPDEVRAALTLTRAEARKLSA